MSIKAKIKQLNSLPQGISLKKALSIPIGFVKNKRLRANDSQHCTFSVFFDNLKGNSHNYFNIKDFTDTCDDISILEIIDRNLRHEFNLLGSGWVKAAYDTKAKGNVGIVYEAFQGNKPEISRNNFSESTAVRNLIRGDYELIDWQLDFKSGWRWSEKTWYKDISFGRKPGADIKIPWELGRMQHLPLFAIAAASDAGCKTGIDENYKKTIANEFRNQVLDFISSNPPRFGVQWACTMDVSLRAVNWLIAYDIFVSAGLEFDSEFIKIFKRSIYEHALHILGNPEWSSGMRGNHYFFNIAGLLFIASYLPVFEESTLMLAFALQELSNEVLYQFLPDGSNFEASTNYHNFVFGAVKCCILLVMRLQKEKVQALISCDFSKWHHFKKLYKYGKNNFSFNTKDLKVTFPGEFQERCLRANEFSADISINEKDIFQIGDNDSGCFLKILPDFSNISFIPQKKPETEANIACREYKDFGVYIFSSSLYKAAVRCGSIGQSGKGGHAHNDQLSLLLSVSGIPVLVDPGTYLYTPFPDKRNLFRSTGMHNTLQSDGFEQNKWYNESPGDLFWLEDHSKARLIIIEKANINKEILSDNTFSGKFSCRFIGEHYGYGIPCRRTVVFGEREISGIDEYSGNKIKIIKFHFHPKITVKEGNNSITAFSDNFVIIITCGESGLITEEYPYSESYGNYEMSNRLKILSAKNVIEWSINILNK